MGLYPPTAVITMESIGTNYLKYSCMPGEGTGIQRQISGGVVICAAKTASDDDNLERHTLLFAGLQIVSMP